MIAAWAQESQQARLYGDHGHLEPPEQVALDRGDNPVLPDDFHPGVEGIQIAADVMYSAIIGYWLLGLGEEGTS